MAGEPHGPCKLRSGCLEQAIHARKPARGSGLVHHSDRGVQYLSIKYSERLAEAGIDPSVGSVGDSYDNALAETINGLYKAEVIHRRLDAKRQPGRFERAPVGGAHRARRRAVPGRRRERDLDRLPRRERRLRRGPRDDVHPP